MTRAGRIRAFIARQLAAWEHSGELLAPGAFTAEYGGYIRDGGGYGEPEPERPDWLKDEDEWAVYTTPQDE